MVHCKKQLSIHLGVKLRLYLPVGHCLTKFSYTYLLMFPHEVSKVPINLNTASKMSLITSGGIRSALISDNVSVLILPTASLASLISGSMVESSMSIAFFLFSSLALSSDCCCFTFSTSVFCSLACWININMYAYAPSTTSHPVYCAFACLLPRNVKHMHTSSIYIHMYVLLSALPRYCMKTQRHVLMHCHTCMLTVISFNASSASVCF